MPGEYNPTQSEAVWQKKWADEKVFDFDLKKAKDPYYLMVMFPYPSGAQLHVGHWFQYSIPDSFGRFQKMRGKNVFHPLGFDAFGLPAENYAIKTGTPPAKSTQANVDAMIEQYKRMGVMFDWKHSLNTSKPEYYRWTQWLFLQMYKNKLAYKKLGNVNYCPKDQTVLANEQVWDGKCERCGSEVIQKPLDQWYWNIMKYSQRLLDGLADLDWPEKTKLMQRNWIGRSEGCDVAWKVDGSDIVLETFTTTVDTIYGVTFAVISPEHPLLDSVVTSQQKDKVADYKKQASKKTDLDRMMDTKEKTGVSTGSFLLHPFTGAKVPLWVADYVLMNYGTGVVMGVPAHDQRDMDFAKTYDFPIVQSIVSEPGESFVYDDVDKYSVRGKIIDSGEFSGFTILDGRKKITEVLEKKKMGKSKIQYKLRDWLVSRQRYWGAPIPIVYDPEGKAHPVPEEHLPWLLPTDVEFKPTGKSPLTESKEFIARTEKIFGKGWRPEFDTMDTFVCSSFYYLRYLMENDLKNFVDKDLEKKWMPVSMYIGGPEHACMHLIYARFVMMALKDFGYVSHSEPFKKLVHQGLVTNKGAKMSKSKGNVVSPDSFVEQYGSDVFRMYLMFMGPFEAGGDWSDTGIKGIVRFVQRLYKTVTEKSNEKVLKDKPEIIAAMHKTIKKVTEDIDGLRFNTAISALMELLNFIEKEGSFSLELGKTIALLIAPLAPHFAEQMWSELGQKDFVVNQSWPSFDAALTIDANMTIVVQVNGKVRGDLVVPKDTPKDDILKKAKELENVQKYLSDELKKEIYVPGKLVSFVV